MRKSQSCVWRLYHKTNSIYVKNSFWSRLRKQMTNLINGTLIFFYSSGIPKSRRVDDINSIVNPTSFLGHNFIYCYPFCLRDCLKQSFLGMTLICTSLKSYLSGMIKQILMSYNKKARLVSGRSCNVNIYVRCKE